MHPDPTQLPRAPRFDEGEQALNRFDDPAGIYRVRYAASAVRGCAIEVLASFRVREPLEERLAAVTNADPQPGDLADLAEPKTLEEAGRVPAEWLARQQVGRFRGSSDAHYVDVLNAWLLVHYGHRQRVRRSVVRHLGEQYDLDAGTILLNLDRGRPVTQAVSAEIWDDQPRPAGIRYASRLDITEDCWAVFDGTPVHFDLIEPLRPDDRHHRAAVRSAADLLELRLPDAWLED